MTSPPPSNLPAPLDRSALERVLARAAELQARTSSDGGDALSEQQLLEIGKEVGISETHLRQALAEERTRVAFPEDAEQGWLDRFAGPRSTHASRVVRGTPADVLAVLDGWMQREECLVVRRRFADRMMWGPRRDLVGSIKRGFNVGGRGYHLTRADDVGATVVAVDAQQTLVRLDASIGSSRSSRIGGGAGMVGVGVATAAIFATVLAPPFGLLAVGPALAFTGGAASLVRQHRKVASRIQLALEQVLDRLEHQEIRRALPGLAEVIGAVTRTMR
jgi:hypothetical protein